MGNVKSVLITGANGFIGSHLVKAYVQVNIPIIAVDREGCSFNLPQSDLVRFIPCEMSHVLSLDGMNIGSPDVVFHLAWEGVSPDFRNDFNMQVSNLTYCMDVVRLASTLKTHKVVMLGSTLEYAYADDPIDETSIPSPQNAYASAKVATHFVCETLARTMGIQLVYAVMASLYGVGREDNNVIFYTICSLLSKQKPLLTKSEQRWDFIHINDAISALCKLGESGRDGTMYAVGNGRNLPLKEYLCIIRDLIDPLLPLGFGELPYQSGRIPNSMINPTRLLQDTGFLPSISFQEGIRDVINWYQKTHR